MQTEGRKDLDAPTGRSSRRGAAAVALILVLVAIGARAANGTFSASQSVAMSSTAAGNVSLTEGTNTMTVQMDLYPGLSAKRVINLTNGSLALKTITVTPSSASFGTSSLDDSITFTVDRCSQAWTGGSPAYDYTCGGSTTSPQVLTSVALDATQRSLTTGSDLTASGVNYYMFTFSLGTGSPAAAYSQSLNVTFTFDATQRDGIPR